MKNSPETDQADMAPCQSTADADAASRALAEKFLDLWQRNYGLLTALPQQHQAQDWQNMDKQGKERLS